jgi:hypothetical protein
MNYEQMRQWRNICEHLDKQWYKFIESDECEFTLLSSKSRSIRQQLWSDYMIQFAQWGQHPYHFYRRDRAYRKVYGWRLCGGWEQKIDFLEQITLFNHNPSDLPQPWRKSIWESVLNRQNRIAEAEALAELRKVKALEEREQKMRMGNCPINFDCKSMSGAFNAGECPNFEQCKQFWSRI